MKKIELDVVLDSALAGQWLDSDEIYFLLSLRDDAAVSRLFKAARQIRDRYFGSKVFLYGFVYFSTYCRNNCRFCHYRKSNHRVLRYRKSASEIIDTACRIADAGAHLIDLTMGEDPAFLQEGTDGFEALVHVVNHVKIKTGRPVMVSAGVISDKNMGRLADAGADWYACYQETHNRSLFKKLRPGQDFDTRQQVKATARQAGLLIEEGLLAGAGENMQDISYSLERMRSLDIDQVRVMSFVPQAGIPLKPQTKTDNLREVVTMAVMRLIFPDRLIPASLDIDGLDGLRRRLDAGANVITSLILPGEGLAGVASGSLDIEDARRTPSGISPVLQSCGLHASSIDDYLGWMAQRQNHLNNRRKHQVC
jgi:methylornithine synthase